MSNAISNLSDAMGHACYNGFSEHTYTDRDWEKYNKWRQEVFDKLSKEEKAAAYLKEYAQVDFSQPQQLTTGVNKYGGLWAQVPLSIWTVGRTFEIYRWCEQVFGAEGLRWKEMYAGRFYFENPRDQMFFALKWS